ncbi:MAG: hypothetical protein M3405_14750 [Acidobacteriota bacterium]|jgi:hypothetical protein|nr:hypothetical protein [Acidobacteriota bacterium]
MADPQNTTQSNVTTTRPYFIDSGQNYPFFGNSDQNKPLSEEANSHKVTPRISIENGNATPVVLKNEFTLFNGEYNKNKRIKKEFYYSYNKWFNEVAHLSLVKQQIAHKSFLKIIGMGEIALPFIFQEFKKQPMLALIEALEAIVGKDVASCATTHREAVRVWLEWGKEKHLIK